MTYLEVTTGLAQAREDRHYLYRYLYHSGDKAGNLSEEDHELAMSLCDGYGKKTVEELRRDNQTWDWSHVRDATPDALAEARAFVEGIISGEQV